MQAATRVVVKGVSVMKKSKKPFKNMNRRSARTMYVNISWWPTHNISIVMKLVTNAKKVGHWATKARRRLPSPGSGAFR